MSELARFYGLIIRMYYDDHPPPHFHVQYGEHQAKVAIDSLAVLNGYLPSPELLDWSLNGHHFTERSYWLGGMPQKIARSY